MRGFTAEEAFDASEAGEALMLNVAQVTKLFDAHRTEDQSRIDFYKSIRGTSWPTTYDAAVVLMWLGY